MTVAGRIGHVDAVQEKVDAGRKAGLLSFLVPPSMVDHTQGMFGSHELLAMLEGGFSERRAGAPRLPPPLSPPPTS